MNHRNRITSLVFALLLCSTQLQAADFKNASGFGYQYGGLAGWQGSILSESNRYRFGIGYTGFALGWDRLFSDNISLGFQGFGNQDKVGAGLSLNYYLGTHWGTGWVAGIDVYRGYETGEFVFELVTDFFFGGDLGENTSGIRNGVSVSVGYQF